MFALSVAPQPLLCNAFQRSVFDHHFGFLRLCAFAVRLFRASMEHDDLISQP
jgi:hypothetical protein